MADAPPVQVPLTTMSATVRTGDQVPMAGFVIAATAVPIHNQIIMTQPGGTMRAISRRATVITACQVPARVHLTAIPGTTIQMGGATRLIPEEHVLPLTHLVPALADLLAPVAET